LARSKGSWQVASTGTHAETVKNMLQLPTLPNFNTNSGIQIGGHLSAKAPSGKSGTNATKAKRERSVDDDDDDDEAAVEEGGKKKRRKRVKKEKVRLLPLWPVRVPIQTGAQDPNAPKRPGSAYIFFQNAVRQEMKAAHPEVAYRDLVSMIATRWGALPDEEKQVRLASVVATDNAPRRAQPYQQEASTAMAQWKVDDASFTAQKAADQPADTPSSLLAVSRHVADSVLAPADGPAQDANNLFKQEDNGIAMAAVRGGLVRLLDARY
jgi:hypothetical protein